VALETTLRFTVISLQEDGQRIVDFLAQQKIFHPEVKTKPGEPILVEAASSFSQKLARISFCLERLEKIRPSSGIREALEDARPEMTLTRIKEKAEGLDLDWLYGEMVHLGEQLDQIEERLAEIEQKFAIYSSLSDLNLRKKDLMNTAGRKFHVFLFRGKPSKIETLEVLLPEPATLFKVASEANGTWAGWVVVISHPSVSENVLKVALETGFEQVQPEGEMNDEETFGSFLDRLLLEKSSLIEKRELLIEKLRHFLSYLDDLKAAYEWYLLEKEKHEKLLAFAKTRKCVLIDGWVPESKAQKLKRELEANFLCQVFVEKEKGSLIRPVLLKNHGPVSSIELLTELYGYPSARESDPTPAIAPWFLLFFGFCIGDVGYGALLIFLGVFLKQAFKLKPVVRSFADIFLYGGIGAVLVGILTGSYFSLEESLIPPFLLSLKLFDPITNPVGILGLSIVLGFLHIFLGIALNAYLQFKEDAASLKFLADIGKMLLLAGAGFYLILFFTGKNMPAIFSLAKYATLSGAFLIVFFSAGGPGSFFKRILTGLYNLYGMTSYLGDISSYARLMALMLASVLIGLAVNIMSGMLIEIMGIYAGLPLAALVAVVGHLFNLLLSIVSAFIHSLRLQFVEFFKQFYSNGGVKFNPLGLKEKYIKAVDQGVG